MPGTRRAMSGTRRATSAGTRRAMPGTRLGTPATCRGTRATRRDAPATRQATPAAMDPVTPPPSGICGRISSPRQRRRSPRAAGRPCFFSAPGEGREAVEIARRITEEGRQGTPFDRIAILLRAPHVYASLVETALARAGIPAFFARGARRPDPAGRALLVLLDCAIDKLSARRFAEYLSLGQVPPLDADGGPPRGRGVWVAAEEESLMPAADDTAPREEGTPDAPADDSDASPVLEGTLRAPWKWEQLLVDSAVIGGRERWRRRLDGLAVEMRLRMEELRQEEPESPRVAAVERDLANLEHLRRFALPVIERLSRLPARATWGEWVAELEDLAPMVLRRPERVLAVLAELRALGPIGPVTLDEVRDVLAEELATVAERPPSVRYGRVFVGTLEQARGRAFDVVFVPGLAERIFPQKLREDPILLDALRGELGSPPDDAGRPRPARASPPAARRRRGVASRVPVLLADRAGGGPSTGALVLRDGGPARASRAASPTRRRSSGKRRRWPGPASRGPRRPSR